MSVFFKKLTNCCLHTVRWVRFRNYFNVSKVIDVETVGETYTWLCDDPQLRLKAKKGSVNLQGYYMLEVSYENNTAPGESELYANYGSGFDAASVFMLGLKRSGVSKRICYFPKPVKSFRWDPSSTPGSISNVKICFVKLTSSFAIKKMKEKVVRSSHSTYLIDSSASEVRSQYDRVMKSFNHSFDYLTWISTLEVTQWAPKTPENILFSIVVPVYNTPIALLKSCVESVINQTYSRWELILVDDCSQSVDVQGYLKTVEDSSSKISVIYRSENGHISAATNTGLRQVNGSFTCFLDHDDLLSPYALNEVSSYIYFNPDVKIVYSDEDKMDLQGERISPYFKPDFNYELMLSHNYMSHFSVIDSTLISSAGYLREGLEGSQDYDLVLRCMKLCKPSNIGHVSKILYHWRMLEGSTAFLASEKDYSSRAGLIAVKDYLSDIHPEWSASHGPVPNSYKVQRNIGSNPLISIVIPTRDQVKILKQCVDSVLSNTDYRNFEVIIIDNGSCEKETFRYFDSIKNKKNIKIINYDKPFNYSEINNYAVNKHARGEYVLLMNNDVEVINKEWLSEMISLASQDNIGCVGAKLFYPDGSIQHAGVTLGIGGVAGHTHKYYLNESFGYFSQLVLPREVSAVTAAVLLVKKSIYVSVGGLDEENLKIAFNDVDFCLKVRSLGLRNVWTPYSQLYHHESISRGHEDTPEKKLRFQKEVEFMKAKWCEALELDPFYNPNLTLTSEDFSIRSL